MTFDQRTERLRGCHPDLVRKVTAIVVLLEQQGYRLYVVEGKRSLARQAWLYAQGRTRKGPIVTWTMRSKHISGRAADLAFLDKSDQPSWEAKYPWSELGKAGRRFGLVWGVMITGKDGRKRHTDAGHVELP